MQAVEDKEGTLWIADDGLGLVKNKNIYDYWILTPNGPSNSRVWALNYSQGDLWVSTGAMSSILTNTYSRYGLHRFADQQWTSFNGSTIPALDSIYDLLTVAIDPRDKQHVYAGAWGQGMLEFNKGVLKAITGPYSRSLTGGIGGMEFDTKNNLWYTSSENGNAFINVLLSGGTTQRYSISGVSTHLGKIHTDGVGQHWVINPRSGGLLVFSEQNGGIQKFLGTGDGEGKLPSRNVTSLAEDKLGQIWVGTASGIAVFYNPSNVLSGGGFDAQQVLVQQDGHTQYLLETETVTAIAVDGGNRKWFGTEGGGVFLMSADGTQQLAHFTSENSPLLSNQILSIAIDGVTGEVFFGTDKGLISYRGTATEGAEDMNEVTVFPNPVREDYTGLIGIRGLTESSSVKITHIDGSLVYETVSDGGQAVWDGRDKNGSRVATGVYLVFCSNPDGSSKAVSKILFIH
jgi:ligand-binding sensor domain-containing protein